MREQVETIGGRLTLESRPGAGTVLEVWLPDVNRNGSVNSGNGHG
jgi:signal transduction histidine kinase